MSYKSSTIRFRQFPILLKLVIFYMGLLCIGQFLTFVYKFFSSSEPVWYDLISAIAYFSLAVGLLTKRRIYRILSILWALIEILNRAFVLALAVFSREIRFDPFEIKFLTFHIPLLEIEWIILWSLLLLLNVAIIAVFMRPDVKSIYSKRNQT